jgi:hypothetical protein
MSYNTGQYPQYAPAYRPPEPVRRVVRQVGVGSAFKVMAVLSALIWGFIGIFLLIGGLCGALSSFPALTRTDGEGSGGNLLALGGVTLVLIYIGGLVFYTLIGGLMGALYALLYNATARLTGGLEIEVG